MATQPNPLTGWQGPDQGGPGSPPGLFPGMFNVSDPAAGAQVPWGAGLKGALAFGEKENAATQMIRNMLAPQFAQRMGAAAGPAADFFRRLMQLGGPFYQQKQRRAFEQSVGQAQGGAAQAREQLGARGVGYGPSGAGAAMFGGMSQAEGGNIAENFLNQLFQNEQLQLQGAQGLQGIAQLFDPARLFGAAPLSNIPETGALDLFKAMFGAAGQAAQGKLG